MFSKQQSFVADVTAQIGKIASSRLGGGLVINNLLEPSTDPYLEKFSSSGRVLDEPFESGTFFSRFDPAISDHDGFVVMELIDRKSGTFDPRVRSVGNTADTRRRLIKDRSVSHSASYSTSNDTSSLVFPRFIDDCTVSNSASYSSSNDTSLPALICFIEYGIVSGSASYSASNDMSSLGFRRLFDDCSASQSPSSSTSIYTSPPAFPSLFNDWTVSNSASYSSSNDTSPRAFRRFIEDGIVSYSASSLASTHTSALVIFVCEHTGRICVFERGVMIAYEEIPMLETRLMSIAKNLVEALVSQSLDRKFAWKVRTAIGEYGVVTCARCQNLSLILAVHAVTTMAQGFQEPANPEKAVTDAGARNSGFPVSDFIVICLSFWLSLLSKT